MHWKREALLSSRLDGESSSLDEVLAGSAKGNGSERSGEASAATGCLQAIELALAKASDRWLRGTELAMLHAELGVPGPPLQSVIVDRFAEDLDQCLVDGFDLPPLVRIGVVQGLLEVNRPFPAGNGRMGRLIVPTLGSRLGIPGARTLALSPLLVKREADYRRHLTMIRDSSRWQAWLGFFLESVAQAAIDTTESIRLFADLRERHRNAIGTSFGHSAVRALRVLESLFQRPSASIAEVRAITGTSYVAANQLASRMMDLGVLEEVTGYRRNRVFRYGAFVRLFAEDRPATGAPTSPTPVVAGAARSKRGKNRPAKVRQHRVESRPGAAPRPTRTGPQPARKRSKAIEDFLL